MKRFISKYNVTQTSSSTTSNIVSIFIRKSISWLLATPSTLYYSSDCDMDDDDDHHHKNSFVLTDFDPSDKSAPVSSSSKGTTLSATETLTHSGIPSAKTEVKVFPRVATPKVCVDVTAARREPVTDHPASMAPELAWLKTMFYTCYGMMGSGGIVFLYNCYVVYTLLVYGNTDCTSSTSTTSTTAGYTSTSGSSGSSGNSLIWTAFWSLFTIVASFTAIVFGFMYQRNEGKSKMGLEMAGPLGLSLKANLEMDPSTGGKLDPHV